MCASWFEGGIEMTIQEVYLAFDNMAPDTVCVIWDGDVECYQEKWLPDVTTRYFEMNPSLKKEEVKCFRLESDGELHFFI